MTNRKTNTILLSILIISATSFAQVNKPATDYINTAGPIMFDKQSFGLNWSAHPAANFYKQEYLMKGDIAGKYKTMILLDVVTGETNIKNVVAAKIAEIKKLKEENPMVNYESFDNPSNGEYMIDFLLSSNTPDSKSMSIVERNVYRYKTFTDKFGQKGILLFGVSTRAYGTAITGFLKSLQLSKKELVNKVAQYKIPEITVAR